MNEESEALAGFEARLRTLLPDTYEVFDEEVLPVSMGSAGLKRGPDGKVQWDRMWGSFCDLAMAGGPPHRGTFLAPSTGEASVMETAAYKETAEEICRGLMMVTRLYAEPIATAGWVRMYCTSAAMSRWLARAITMENVCAVSRGLALDLPAGAGFRVEKEIKNVITSVAKTCHYWQEHMSDAKHDDIAELLAFMERESPLVYAILAPSASEGLDSALEAIELGTGLPIVVSADRNWAGIDCRDIPEAIWMMRALAVSNLLSRREGTIVFFPMAAAQEGSHFVLLSHRLHVVSTAAG